MHTHAYLLGCKYAAALSEGTKALLERYLASRPAQYAIGGLGGAGLGALLGGEDNRLRGAILGAGAGLGGTALGRMGAGAGAGSISSEAVHKQLLERGLKDRPKNLEKLRQELERAAATRGVQVAAPLGVLGGMALARPLAPTYED